MKPRFHKVLEQNVSLNIVGYILDIKKNIEAYNFLIRYNAAEYEVC